MKYSHNCIKCGTKYSDDDVDAYYCASCNEERKIIAKEVDKRLATTYSKRQVKSDLQMFDELAKSRGHRGFVSAKDLGIIL